MRPFVIFILCSTRNIKKGYHIDTYALNKKPNAFQLDILSSLKRLNYVINNLKLYVNTGSDTF